MRGGGANKKVGVPQKIQKLIHFINKKSLTRKNTKHLINKNILKASSA